MDYIAPSSLGSLNTSELSDVCESSPDELSSELYKRPPFCGEQEKTHHGQELCTVQFPCVLEFWGLYEVQSMHPTRKKQNSYPKLLQETLYYSHSLRAGMMRPKRQLRAKKDPNVANEIFVIFTNLCSHKTMSPSHS